jgi:hypothetical protein
MKGKKVVLSLLLAILCLSSYSNEKHQYDTISKAELNNKIKGAWAGKMIGVAKGIGMEFQAAGVTYEDSIMWYPGMIERALLEDDIYGQLGFMDTMVVAPWHISTESPSGSSIAITARKQVNGMATGNTSSTKWILQMETTH